MLNKSKYLSILLKFYIVFSIIIFIVILLHSYINTGVFKASVGMIAEVDNYNIQVLNDGMVLDLNQKKDYVITTNAKAYKIVEEEPIGSELSRVLIIKGESNEKPAYLIYREAYSTWYFIDYPYERLGPFTGGIVKLNNWEVLKSLSTKEKYNPQMIIEENVKSGDDITLSQINELKHFIEMNEWIVIK